MSSYFFHLKLELYQTPARSVQRQASRKSATRSSSRATTDPTEKVFLPTPQTDIFKTPLPAHRTTKWTSCSFSKRNESPASNGATTPSRGGADLADFTHQASPEVDRRESHGDALLLPERSLNLRKEVPPSPRIRATSEQSNDAAARDWRYERVTIESIDMEKSKANPGGLHTKAVYLPSDPKTTEVGWGVVHLYRDAEESQAGDGHGKSLERVAKGKLEDDQFDVDDCSTLCILAVPSWMMPSDLLGFVGDQAREDVSHFRLIRTGRANKYMVLMKFRSAKKARDWQKAHNGRLFSAAEPENCHVVFVKSVEFLAPEEDHGGTSFPHNNHDPFTASKGSATGLPSKPFAPPPPNLLELPTCPVCLERMDETTGLLTILCQHVFHCACLEKWRGSGCPVCRYTHSPSYTFPYPRPGTLEEETEPMCSVCAGSNNLWICLICGNVGCGRYDDAHAFKHYEETSHCYAMDINTQHVWDYAGDGYVHRLIQSKPPPTPAAHDHSSGGGILDMPVRRRHENEAFRAEGGDSVPREKMESMATEYTYLLTSQLEGQRKYFEEQVERAVDKARQASQRADDALAAAHAATTELERARASSATTAATVARLEHALDKSEQARRKFESLARDVTRQLREEKTMSEGLVQRIRAVEERGREADGRVETLEREKAELRDLNHDLTMFISSQEKVRELQERGEEVVDGRAFVPEVEGKGKKGKKGKKGMKGKGKEKEKEEEGQEEGEGKK